MIQGASGAALPPGQRQALELRTQGQTYEAIGQALGVTREAARKRVTAAERAMVLKAMPADERGGMTVETQSQTSRTHANKATR